MKRVFLVLISIFSSCQVLACFILCLTDGQQVLVGNHEDWFAKDAALRINPPTAGKYGSVTFTFMNEGWAQGGMNEHGLFFDAAYTPFQEITYEGHVEKFSGNIWQHMLDNAATVKEALTLLSRFELPDLREANIILADASGNVGWLGIRNGKISMEEINKPYVIQTNFNPYHPEISEEPGCWRFQKATQELHHSSTATIDNLRTILEATHQESLTVYSNIYDLKNRIIHTYNKRNFSSPIDVRLPDIFRYGSCTLSLDSLAAGIYSWDHCSSSASSTSIFGYVTNKQTGEPVPFVNIGLWEKNVGTLSDPDGSYELEIPGGLKDIPVIFSSVGYGSQNFTISELKKRKGKVSLIPESKMLDAVTVLGKKTKVARLGWMGGRDGVLPFDTIQGGGAVALLVESPKATCYADKLQVRLMYNSKDTLKFRFHIYAYDSVRNLPGEELLSREIMLKETKKFGWLRFDLSKYDIMIPKKKFLIGFEWIDNRQTRQDMLKGLRAWERWKLEQYRVHNDKIEKVIEKGDGDAEIVHYKYHGNMMNWPGFKDLPPFTGLMVETGKKEETRKLTTFERKTSFGAWQEISSTLNAVISVNY